FERKTNDQLYATATHEDGSEIKVDSRARRGELVSLFGTGFGPYDRRVPDGFSLPAETPYTLVDPIQVMIGDTAIDVDWAGGAPGQVGMSLARFRLPDDVAAHDGVVALRVRINGRDSNTVFLVVE